MATLLLLRLLTIPLKCNADSGSNSCRQQNRDISARYWFWRNLASRHNSALWTHRKKIISRIL